jgi:hypothetical protein
MAEETEVDDEPKTEPKSEPLPDLDKVTFKHLQDLEHKLRKEYAGLREEDDRERIELRAKIEELEEEKEARKKAEEAKDHAKDTESTMVLPPHDIPPQQPNPSAPATHVDGAGKKQSLWKRVW